MPTYMCPKCGRTVEQPIGEYTCKVCHTQMRPVEAIALPTAGRMQPMMKYFDGIRSQILDESEASNIYTILKENALKLGRSSDASLLSDIANDERKHERLLRTILASR